MTTSTCFILSASLTPQDYLDQSILATLYTLGFSDAADFWFDRFFSVLDLSNSFKCWGQRLDAIQDLPELELTLNLTGGRSKPN